MSALQSIQCSCLGAGAPAPAHCEPEGVQQPWKAGRPGRAAEPGCCPSLVEIAPGFVCCCAICHAPLPDLDERQALRALRPYRWFVVLVKLRQGADRLLPSNKAFWRPAPGAGALQKKAYRPLALAMTAVSGKAGRVTFARIFRATLARWRAADAARPAAADPVPPAGPHPAAQILGTLAHELKHPLGPLSSGLSILRLKADEPLAVRQTVAMMERQVSQMSELINHMLDITRISTGKLGLRKEWVALETLIASAIETTLPLMEAAGHVLRVTLPEPALRAELDPRRMVQVLVNLLNNAAKYTPAGGLIEVSACRQGDEVVITVTDNGVGMAEASLASVFDMFSQEDQGSSRAQSGLGIGLALVRQLVQMHGGTACAASAGPGRGSTFTLRLPQGSASGDALAGAATTTAPGPAPAPQARATGLRILVVDDHEEAATALAHLLELNGHTSAVAHDGWQALEKARAFRPEVVFLDLSMPGMNGYETARALRAMAGLERITLVALTGWSDKESRERSKTASFDHHLSKPVDLATIQGLLSPGA